MRRTLGTAVFSGMLGVTLFGIFLTPVFFYAIDWLGGTRLFASRSWRVRPANCRWGSCVCVRCSRLAEPVFASRTVRPHASRPVASRLHEAASLQE